MPRNLTLQRWLVAALFAAFSAIHAHAGVEVNQANEAELNSILGIGPGLSEKILQERAKGPFKDWQDLMQRVKGIRARTALKFSDGGLTVQGSPFQTKAPTSQEEAASAP
jgi:competence protein ComEA